MKSRNAKSRTVSLDKDEGEECGGVIHSNGEVKLGDLIWVKDQGSWWPGQVVDANTVSDDMKPDNRSIGEVLVRFYGSYNYLYVDPAKYRAEFETILKHNNGSYIKILENSLKQELPECKLAKSKGRGSRDKMLVHDELDMNQESKGQKSGSHPLEDECAGVSGRRGKTRKAGLAGVSTDDNHAVADKQGRKLRSATKNNRTDNENSIADTPQSTVKNGSVCSEEIQNGSRKSYRQNKRKLEANGSEITKKSNSVKSKTNVVQGETKVDMSTEKAMNNRIADTWELKVNNSNDGTETSKNPDQDWVQKEVMLIVSSVMEDVEPDSPKTKNGKDIPQT